MNLEFKRGIPCVAASFTDIPVNMDVIKSQGLDIAEIRVDLCENQSVGGINEVLRAFQAAGIKTMLTIRSHAHGGRWTSSHDERIDLMLRTYEAVDIIDIEDDCEVPNDLRMILKSDTHAGPLLLISHHNTKGTPSFGDLCDIRDRALLKKPHLIKIATHIRRDIDVQCLAKFILAHEEGELIVIGMGLLGLITRIQFPQFGSPITFCYREAPTAPGQLTLDDTVSFLRTFYPLYDEAMERRLISMKFV